jgi:hypothetical protein
VTGVLSTDAANSGQGANPFGGGGFPRR